MSYGGSINANYRQAGVYAGRILKMLWGGSGEHISIAALSDPMEPRHDETPTNKGGTLKYLEWAAVHKAERFIALMARVAPKQVFAEVAHRAALTAEVEAELRERGLPVELLDSLLTAPDELDDDEDPDPYHLMRM